MKISNFIVVISAILLAACGAQPLTLPTSTSLPPSTTTTHPTLEPTSIPPTPAFQFVEIKNGGFSLSVHPDLEYDIDDYSINLSDSLEKIVISLNGRTYIASAYTMESFLDTYVNEIASRGGTFIQSDTYEITIDGMQGTAVDISGDFKNSPIAGKAFVISPAENFIIFGLGMSNLNLNANEWVETGSDIFETLLASIKFKDDIKK